MTQDNQNSVRGPMKIREALEFAVIKMEQFGVLEGTASICRAALSERETPQGDGPEDGVEAALRISKSDASHGPLPMLGREVERLRALASRPDAPSEAQVQLEAWQTVFGATQLSHALARLEAAEKRADAVGLKQKIWDALRIMGFDTDGDPTPAALVTDIGDVLLDFAAEFRKNYDEALSEMPDAPPSGLSEAEKEALEVAGCHLRAGTDTTAAILASLVTRLSEENGRQRVALEFYANTKRYDYDNDCCFCPPENNADLTGVLQDEGEFARETLGLRAELGRKV